MKHIIAAAAAAGIALLVSGCSAPATVQACPEEDYTGPIACHWDAAAQGNGQGTSFFWTGSTIIYPTTR
jgi:hypothetical protein